MTEAEISEGLRDMQADARPADVFDLLRQRLKY